MGGGIAVGAATAMVLLTPTTRTTSPMTSLLVSRMIDGKRFDEISSSYRDDLKY